MILKDTDATRPPGQQSLSLLYKKLALRYSWIYDKNLANEVQYIITSYISL